MLGYVSRFCGCRSRLLSISSSQDVCVCQLCQLRASPFRMFYSIFRILAVQPKSQALHFAKRIRQTTTLCRSFLLFPSRCCLFDPIPSRIALGVQEPSAFAMAFVVLKHPERRSPTAALRVL